MPRVVPMTPLHGERTVIVPSVPPVLEYGSYLLLALFILLSGIWMCAKAATTSSANHSNSLGVVIEYGNPNTYKMGSIRDAAIVGSKREATSVRLKPSYTPNLYDESLLFCGNVAEKIIDAKTQRILRGPLLFTYRTQASQTVDGVACHQLIAVDKIQDKTP